MATNAAARKRQLETIIPKLRSEPFGGGGEAANRAASRYFSRLAEEGQHDAEVLPDTVVLCGDFNLCATTTENVTISRDGSLHDLWAVLHPGDPGWSEDSEVNGMLKVLKPDKEQKFRYDRIVLIQPRAATEEDGSASESESGHSLPPSPVPGKSPKHRRKLNLPHLPKLFRRSSGGSPSLSARSSSPSLSARSSSTSLSLPTALASVSLPNSPTPLIQAALEAPARPSGQTLSAELQVNAVAVERLGLKAVDAGAEVPLWPSDHFGLLGTLRLQPSVQLRSP